MDVKGLGSLFKERMGNKLLIILGIAGIALIYLSSLFGSGSGKTAPKVQENTVQISAAETEKRLEENLNRLVAAITGEEGEVMVTLENTGEAVLAADKKSSAQKEATEEEHTYLILKDSDGTQHAVTVREVQPEIKGVVVVSKYADNAVIREKLVEAVKTALGVSSAKVCVTSAK